MPSVAIPYLTLILFFKGMYVCLSVWTSISPPSDHAEECVPQYVSEQCDLRIGLNIPSYPFMKKILREDN